MSIKIRNLSKSFGDKVIFNDFNLEFKDKGLYVICGESGVGKTTLLRILAGLDNEFNGDVIKPQKASVCFQEQRLFSHLSVLENVSLISFENPSDIVIQRSTEMLLKLGFTETELKQYPRELSGGMKQRCSLARAFLYDAPVLLLDEPTKELDKDLKNIVINLILEESKKRLVIVITHDDDIKTTECEEIIEIKNMH